MRLVDANNSPPVQGEVALLGKVNYFIGNDPHRWRTNIPTFAKVQYRDVYPGTDLVYYSNQDGRLEYDFVLAPGADPNLIALEFDGADRIELDASGDLMVWVGGRPVRWQKPVVYQEFNGSRTEIAGAYRIHDGALAFQADAAHRIGFELAAYDRSRPLIIDPVLVYSTYLGGSEWDRGGAITTDVHGNAVVVGSTESMDFPTRGAIDPEIDGGSDAFVAKLSSSGELLYASYLGGASWDQASAVQLDSAGNIHLVGSTSSTNYPVVNPLQSFHAGYSDVFVTILSPDGSAINFSTYLGGSSGDFPQRCALDASGNIYLAGPTASEDFPVLNALYSVRPGMGRADNYNDFFVTKLTAGGKSIVYSTYFGGSAHDFVEGIAADAEGHAYIVCYTDSMNLPIKDAVQPFFAGKEDMYYAKILPDGSGLVYGSYFGGSDWDGVSAVAGVALGPDGAFWIAGSCLSRGLATAGAFQTDFSIYPVSILAKFNAVDGSLMAATYFDSTDTHSIAVDAVGDVWIGGKASEGLTLVNPIQPNYGGSGPDWVHAADGYVAKFSSDCSTLLFSTYFGGATDGEAIRSLAVDPKGDLLFIGANAHSEGLPIVNAFQPEHGGESDAFVGKISMAEVLKVSRSGQTLELSWPASASGFVLESATTLADGGDWQDFPTPPTEVNGQKVNTVGTTNAGYFRLRKP